jgi:CDP-6-deoxy-D-xylo-4-hexulose-3-dehydrase
MFATLIRPESGIRRAHFQQYMEKNGVDTRMVWTGNVARQPAFKKVPMRIDPSGLPNADRVMDCGVILPMNHAQGDAPMHFIGDLVDAYVKEHAR